MIAVGISFPSLSTSQSCMVATSCKILCRVRARPTAVTDWKKVDTIKQLEGWEDIEGQGYAGLVVVGSKYKVYPDGLLIRNVTSTDEGGYICRARVDKTGQLEERIIKLKVILTKILLQVMNDHHYLRYKSLLLGSENLITKLFWKVNLRCVIKTVIPDISVR